MNRIFLGGSAIGHVPADDRGLAYGDGVFETMRGWKGDIPWWADHWERLAWGAARLAIPLPNEDQVREEALALLEGRSDVIKLLLTRGPGTRGYAPVAAPPLWVLRRDGAPPVGGSVSVRWCHTRLAIQPALAGMKHCNRLEQVLARAEWTASTTEDDGLLCATNGEVVSAISANLFVLRKGVWITPPLDHSGVRGTCRSRLLAGDGTGEARLSVADVETADAVFLCNAVRGILEVSRLGLREFAPHPAVALLRERLAHHHPAFRPESP